MSESWKMTRADLTQAIEDFFDQVVETVPSIIGDAALQFHGAQLRIHLKDRPDGTCYVVKIEGDKSAYKCINLQDMPDGRNPRAQDE